MPGQSGGGTLVPPPVIPSSIEWNHGICEALGWLHEDQAGIARVRQRILSGGVAAQSSNRCHSLEPLWQYNRVHRRMPGAYRAELTSVVSHGRLLDRNSRTHVS